VKKKDTLCFWAKNQGLKPPWGKQGALTELETRRVKPVSAATIPQKKQASHLLGKRRSEGKEDTKHEVEEGYST